MGWPGQEELPQLLKPYWVHQHDFHCNGDLLMKGQWIVIPETLQPEMLDRVHDGHMGITKCRLRPQQWLGLSTQIAKLVAKCDVCTKCQPGHREPMMATELTKRPWQKVAADMFYWKNDTYLLVVDYYSRHIEIAKTPKTPSAGVTNGLKSILSRQGGAEVLVTENAPQFSASSFSAFAAE